MSFLSHFRPPIGPSSSPSSRPIRAYSQLQLLSSHHHPHVFPELNSIGEFCESRSARHSMQPFVCAICGNRFGRTGPGFKAALELKDRRCPFCDFEWARPDKIKHHIPMHHPDRSTAEVMAISQDLHGKNVVAFLDDLDHDSRPLVWR